MNTSDLLKLLRGKYSDKGYALFTEVGNGTGMHHSRWADALVISLWPSRGLEILGFELKVSRSDWVKELNHPEKAEAVCKYCDRWFVVAGNGSIVQRDELPETWGLMVADGNGLRIEKPAPKLSPIPADRAFIAAIARRAVEQTAAAEELSAAFDRGEELGRQDCGRELRELRELEKRATAFHEATGISLDPHDWGRFAGHDAKKIGAAVLAVLGKEDYIHSALDQMRYLARQVIEQVDAAIGTDTKTKKRSSRGVA